MNRQFLIFLTILYLFLLNIIVNRSLEEITLSLLPTCILLLLSLIFTLLGTRFLKLFLALQILIASTALFFKWQYNVTITEDIMLSGLINDASLTLEMVSFKLLVWVLFTAFVPIYLLFKIDINKHSYFKILNQTFIWFVLCVIGLGAILYFGGYKLRGKGQIRDPHFAQALGHFSPLDAEYALIKAYKAKKKLIKKYAHIKPPQQSYTMKENNLLVVFVMGESTRGDHFSLNGYNKNTNPKLSSVPDLFSFSNVKSCDTLTINSLHCFSSPMKHTQKNRIPTEAPFTRVMHDLGFNIELYSLQTLSLFYHYLGYDTLLSKYAILNNSKKGEAKDTSLLPYALKSIQQYKKGKKLLILHTLGSHQTYYDRINSKDILFTPYRKSANVAACSQKSLINAYDNTILGIDAFLYKIIAALKEKKALLVYLSDHGESLGENGIYFHGKPVDIAPKEQFNIPWLIWLSPKYRATANGVKILKTLKSTNKKQPFSHDNFYDSILGCSSIEAKNKNSHPSLDICHE